jgi:RNA polymerase sigma factor (sigma-70 family)
MFVNRNLASVSDSELLDQFKVTGDLLHLSNLFVRYTSVVYGVCLKYLKDRDESKDMVMQIFEKLPSRVTRHEITHFKSWLYVTTRNECLMHLRAGKGKVTQEINDHLMENEVTLHLEEEPEMETNLTKLEKCIEELTYEQKQCVQMFFLQEKCYRDITDVTGFDLGKVKSYIQNGKRNLKICMERNG